MGYGFYHHMATVQGHMERAPNVRPFVLTRSFFAGSHKNGAVWTGDNQAKWGHLARSVPMLVSLALCGISFAGADVPGFFYNPELELFRRWHQLGVWYPFYRGHAHLETKRREPWMLGDEITAMVREQVTVRYQLLPTWYTLFAEWAGGGQPILLPTWFHNLEDAEAYGNVDKQFLVGEGILVYAITESTMKQANVYLPTGEWFDYWSLKPAAPIAGGKVLTTDLHNDHVPVYVRSGSILFKKMRRRRSTGAMVGDPYTIIVYGATKASGRLYVDDGNSHEYQTGAYIYDEFTFDGKKLEAKKAPKLPGFADAAGLSSAPQKRLRIERIIFVGLSKQPSDVQLESSGTTTKLQAVTEQAEGGTWTATIKQPGCFLGTGWSLSVDSALQI